MPGARFEPNKVDLDALLKSEEVIAILREIGDKAADAAGGEPDDYQVEEWIGEKRARVTVSTATFAAAARERRDHLLLNALDAVTDG